MLESAFYDGGRQYNLFPYQRRRKNFDRNAGKPGLDIQRNSFYYRNYNVVRSIWFAVTGDEWGRIVDGEGNKWGWFPHSRKGKAGRNYIFNVKWRLKLWMKWY